MQEILELKTVSFNSNGGTQVEDQLLMKGERVIRPADPLKDHFKFTSWYDSNSMENEWDFNSIPKRSLTLFGNWRDYSLNIISQEGVDFGIAEVGYEDIPPGIIKIKNTTDDTMINITAVVSDQTPPPPQQEYFLVSPSESFILASAEEQEIKLQPKSGLPVGVYRAVLTISGRTENEGRQYSHNIELLFAVNPSPIKTVSITVSEPVTDTAAAAAIIKEDEGSYTHSEAMWNPADSIFAPSVSYTVSVNLTSDTGYMFTDETEVYINGSSAQLSLADNGLSAVASYQFPQTAQRVITEIKATAINLVYEHTDKLDLSSLVITVFYDTGYTEDIAYRDFVSKNITVNYAHDHVLLRPVDNGKTLTAVLDSHNTQIGDLIVNVKVLSDIIFPQASVIADGYSLSVCALTGGDTHLGSFLWADSGFIPPAGVNGFDMIFTPADVINFNYDNISGWNGISVIRAVPVTVIPNEAGIILELAITDIVDGTPVLENGIIISRSNTGSPVFKILEIANPALYDAGSIEWELVLLDGTKEIQNGNSFTLDATDERYNSLGKHLLVLKVAVNGMPYQRNIYFTVVK